MNRVLVVGHGGIGKVRAAALHGRGRDHGASLVGTVDPLARDTALYGGAPHFPGLASVPSDAYDSAVVALPHDLARSTVELLLAAGKRVLLEKPLGLSGAEATALADAARKAGLACFVGYNYRFLPNVLAAFQAARSGHLGKLRSIDMLLGHGGHPGSAKEWKLDPKRAGGGVIIDPGVHLLDLLQVVAPGLEPLLAQGSTGFFKTGIEEDVTVVLRDGECLATVRVSHVRWVNGFRIELVGEDGYALVEGRGATYGPMTVRLGKRWAWSDGTKRTQRETEESRDFGAKNESFEAETAAVLDKWAGRAVAVEPASFDDGVRVAKLCDRLYAMLGAR
ncbi:MAG: Gfo/Idh/MocA family oxidoreductase [Archangiaceae bacterium]|nr:Gfo/Idh/MocA family oxidoreductase [Archangiaceae bacterium]